MCIRSQKTAVLLVRLKGREQTQKGYQRYGNSLVQAFWQSYKVQIPMVRGVYVTLE